MLFAGDNLKAEGLEPDGLSEEKITKVLSK